MVLNTLTVASSVTPTVIETYFSHYLNRKPLRQKPTAHISYHEGLQLVRRFLHHASFHTVEEIQAFTGQWVPVPQWVKTDEVVISEERLSKAAELLCAQLGPEGIKQVGGTKWWQWRRENTKLKAEWIEMRKDYNERKKAPAKTGERIMLYIHGGAYYFGSVDEHRYQMQRHARKLKARVFAPRYRLSPQFPFPCAIHDGLATYLHLLESHEPSSILLAGDSAGGGMTLSILCILRDQGIPLPAGVILLSPWVDLTHSFPSLGGSGEFDYIPSHGFVHKPSVSWPPPNLDDLKALEEGRFNSKTGMPEAPKVGDKKEQKAVDKQEKADRTRGYSVNSQDKRSTDAAETAAADIQGSAGTTAPVAQPLDNATRPGPDTPLTITIDGNVIEIKDQIQIYAANHLLTHPLVSPVLQPTLGGLPPMLIQVGGGELLRDEQIYLAHKAAAPLIYVPAPTPHLSAEEIQAQFSRYKPTNVQLQVWDDLCHVAPTLSFTRPAKYMYRSIAQFGAWALARAQQTAIEIDDDSSISTISIETNNGEVNDGIVDAKASNSTTNGTAPVNTDVKLGAIGKAGDALPPFEKHMIRQRVDRNGNVFPMTPATEMDILKLSPTEIGVIKPGPVRKWMDAQTKWNKKFASQKLKVQKRRMADMAKGFEGFDGERPPPTALAGRRLKDHKGGEQKRKKSWGLGMWTLWGSKHDEVTIEREENKDDLPAIQEEGANGTAEESEKLATAAATSRSRRRSSGQKKRPRITSASRSRSHTSAVTDRGQADQAEGAADENVPLQSPLHLSPTTASRPGLSRNLSSDSSNIPALHVEGLGTVIRGTNTIVPDSDTQTSRPKADGIAYPFKLRLQKDAEGANASTVTLNSINPSFMAGASGRASTDLDGKSLQSIEKTEANAQGVEVAPVGLDAGNADVRPVETPIDELEKSVVEGKVIAGSQRPPVERFVTANEL